MSVRRSVPLALAAAFAAVGCRDVNQRDPAPVLALAAFDPGEPGVRAATLPLPNDLALQGAPSLPAGATRTGLFQLIDLGGWPPDLTNAAWAPFQGIAVPVRAEAYDEATGAYAPTAAPAAIVPETVNASTVAIVRLDGGSPAVVPPALVGYSVPATTVGYLVLRPSDGTNPVAVLPPGRYVVAVRGGPDGVQTVVGEDRVPLEADRAIALVTPDRDLTERDNQPPGGLAPDQIERLERLRGSFAVGMDWNRNDVAGGLVCLAALGVTAAQLPENRCWLPPIPTPPMNQPLPTPDVTAAFAGVDLVFPHEEIASIQTFEVFTPPTPTLQEEVTP